MLSEHSYEYADPKVLAFVEQARMVPLRGARLLNALAGDFYDRRIDSDAFFYSEKLKQDVVLSRLSMADLENISDDQFLLMPNLGRKCLSLFRQFVPHVPWTLED